MKYYLSSELSCDIAAGFWISGKRHLLCNKFARKILKMKKRHTYQLLLTDRKIPGSIRVRLKRIHEKICWRKPNCKWDNMSEDAEDILNRFMNDIGIGDRGEIFVRPFKVS